MKGEHQKHNAAVAIAIVSSIQEHLPLKMISEVDLSSRKSRRLEWIQPDYYWIVLIIRWGSKTARFS